MSENNQNRFRTEERGLIKGYVPSDNLDIGGDVTLHQDYAEDLDPVTYEVIRHRLWTINEEHSKSLANISGSPVAAYARDFNSTLLKQDGELILNGPYVQLFSPIAELQAKWILEYRSDEVGIEPGDIFLANDPWVGSTHQSDVFFLKPIFYNGEIFCWVVNTLHQYDLGGSDAGSFCYTADDVYTEPTPIPPIKIVSGGKIRQDLREMYMRQSRLPVMVGIDFNAQVAALREAGNKFDALIEDYGHQTVKAVMEKIIEDSETQFVNKLSDIPDGTWRTRTYEGGSHVGDTNVHPIELQLTKKKDKLIFRNEGTGENTGTINITYGGFRTAISCILNPMLFYDQLWASGGAYRHIDIKTEPGTINRASHPSAISAAGVNAIRTFELIGELIIQMLSASDASREDIICGGASGYSVTSVSGVDQWGEPYGTIISAVAGGGFGARTSRDGIDTGGPIVAGKMRLPNIEANEQDYPILYLSRREAQDTSGHGEYRGGVGMVRTWAPHKTEEVNMMLAGHGALIPNIEGIGAEPPSPVANRVASNTDIVDQFEDGQLPRYISEITGSTEISRPKAEKIFIEPDDVVESRAGSGAGYGDPIKRPPQKVAKDVEQGVVSESVARSTYGVVIQQGDDTVSVDEEATESLRNNIVKERLNKSTIPEEER
jgi:N-methylhydantoinase B